MRRAKIILVAALAILMAGCALSGKTKTPPTPPAPKPAAAPPPELSIHQTQVELGPAQPFDERALNTATAPVEPAASTPVKPPTTTSPPRTPPKATPAPKPQTEPQTPETVARPPIQEILTADQLQTFENNARAHRSEASSLIRQATQRRRLTLAERGVVTNITQILKQSEQAEKNGDMRAADSLAERAHILAKELQSGK